MQQHLLLLLDIEMEKQERERERQEEEGFVLYVWFLAFLEKKDRDRQRKESFHLIYRGRERGREKRAAAVEEIRPVVCVCISQLLWHMITYFLFEPDPTKWKTLWGEGYMNVCMRGKKRGKKRNWMKIKKQKVISLKEEVIVVASAVVAAAMMV